MQITRRQFLKSTGVAVVGGVTLAYLGIDVGVAEAAASDIQKTNRLRTAKKSTSTCCYCSVGCGLICSTDETGTVFHIEGDPDHPISEGALCAKGANMMQTTSANKHRLTDVLYRAPYSDKWEKKDWDWALTRIAEKIKTVRDADFLKTNAEGKTVNRLEAIAVHGSSNVNNEECYMMTSMSRALGLVYIDHQARV